MMLIKTTLLLLSLVWMGRCAPPPRCCFDQEFTANLGQIGAVANEGTNSQYFIDGYVELASSFYESKQGTRAHSRKPDGSMQTLFRLEDFANKREYNQEGNGTCTYKILPETASMYASCIPETAKWLGSATVGFGLKSLMVDTWVFSGPIPGLDSNNIRVTMSVTRQHCIPFAETLVGNFTGAPTELSLFYTGYHPGVAHTDLLTPPPNCHLFQEHIN